MTDGIMLTVIVPLAMFLMMFGLGTTLNTDALKAALKNRLSLSVGLFAQILVVPICGAITILMFDLPVEFKLGIMLLACCPGGTSSNLFCHLGRGNLALSVSLTALSSLVVLITMPLILQLTAFLLLENGQPIDIPQLEILKRLFFMTLLPIACGVMLSHYSPKIGRFIADRTGTVGLLFLIFLAALILFKEWALFVQYLPIMGLTIAFFMGCILTVVMIMLRYFPMHDKEKFTIFVEASIQSSALAMFISLTVLDDGAKSAIPAGLYSLAMYIVGFTLVYWHRRKRLLGQEVAA